MTALAAPVLQIQVISSLPELEAARGEWEALWLSGRDVTPFQSPAWLIPWWKAFGAEQQLFTLAFRDRGELAGLAPLFIWTNPEPRRRELLFIGTGISDWLGPLCAPGFESIMAESFRTALGTFRFHWDFCDLQQLRASSPLLTSDREAGIFGERTTQTSCPAINLSDESSRARAEKMIVRGETCKRRLNLRGETHVVAAQRTDFCKHFSALLRLHSEAWNARGQTGVLTEFMIQQFHEQAALQLLDACCLRLYSLYFKDDIIASFYGFADGRRFYYYLGGYDPEFSSFSPGTILIGHAVRCALEEGSFEFDFLRGCEAYKYTWGATDRPAFRIVFCPTARQHR
jgi:CelD/BcsL family acetyltransferase involved in cellulose biosynthesis